MLNSNILISILIALIIIIIILIILIILRMMRMRMRMRMMTMLMLQMMIPTWDVRNRSGRTLLLVPQLLPLAICMIVHACSYMQDVTACTVSDATQCPHTYMSVDAVV